MSPLDHAIAVLNVYKNGGMEMKRRMSRLSVKEVVNKKRAQVTTMMGWAISAGKRFWEQIVGFPL
jgi:hypothetical protein